MRRIFKVAVAASALAGIASTCSLFVGCGDDASEGSPAEDAAAEGATTGPADSGLSSDAPLDEAASDAADAKAPLTVYPVVVWTDTAPGHEAVYLRRWSGTAWVDLGGSGSGDGIGANTHAAMLPSVGIDLAGEPIVGWVERLAGNRYVYYVKRWTGSAWAELAGSATSEGVSGDATTSALDGSMAVDSKGRVAVAWQAVGASSMVIRVRRFDGTAWQDLGGAGSGAGFGDGDNVRVAFDGLDRLIVAWRGGGGLYLKRWSGTSWEELGGSSSDGGVSGGSNGLGRLDVAAGPDDHPVVAWEAPTTILFKRWDGAAWQELGGSGTGGGIGPGEAPSIVIEDLAHPVVSGYVNGGLPPVYRWNGQRWENLVLGVSVGMNEHIGLAGLGGGSLFAAYRLDNEIQAKIWTGYTWQGIGGSATALGLSNTFDGLSFFPAVYARTAPTIPKNTPGEACHPPLPLTFSQASPAIAIATGDTSTSTDDDKGSCIAQTSGGDLVYAFTTTATAKLDVQLTTTSGSYQPAVYLRPASCLAADQACAKAGFAGGTAQLSVASLPASTWLLFVDGEAKSAGPFTLNAMLTP